jgi:hypothetical protein
VGEYRCGPEYFRLICVTANGMTQRVNVIVDTSVTFVTGVFPFIQ